MSSTAPNVPTPRKHTPGSPLWATVLDRSLPFVLASAGLLVPDHVGTFYLALLVGFVGIAGVVLTGAALVTFLCERQTLRIKVRAQSLHRCWLRPKTPRWLRLLPRAFWPGRCGDCGPDVRLD